MATWADSTWADIKGWLEKSGTDPITDIRLRTGDLERNPRYDATEWATPSSLDKTWDVEYKTGEGAFGNPWKTYGTYGDLHRDYGTPATEGTETYTVQLTDGSLATYDVGFGPFPKALAGDTEFEEDGLLDQDQEVQLDQDILDAIAAAIEAASAEYNPDTAEWGDAAFEAWALGSDAVRDAWVAKYAHFGTDLKGLQDEMPELPNLTTDYAKIDELIKKIETGATPADRSAAREEVAQNYGYKTWDEFKKKLGAWESSKVNTTQVEKDAARQMGYASWADYQTALKAMGYTELSPFQIRAIAAKDLGFNSWGEYQAAIKKTQRPEITGNVMKDIAAKSMGFDSWAKYKEALDASGSYTYATDEQLRERTAKDLGFNTWDEFQTKQKALQTTALSDPSITQADQETAISLGFETPEKLRAELERLRGALTDENGVDVTGLTAEERDVYERQRSQAVRQAERRANDQMEAVLGNTGSMTQYLAAADEANNRIIDINLKYEMAEMNQDMALQTETLGRMMSIYTGLFEGQQQGIHRSLDRQIRQLEIANQQFLTQLTRSAAQIQEYGKLDIEKSELAEQRYGTLQGAMAEHQRRIVDEDVAREGMATDRYKALLTSGERRIGDLTTAEYTRTGQADARKANLRRDFTSAYGTIMATEIERVRGDTTKFIELVKAGNAGVQDILKMKQNGVMAALTGYFEKANLKIFEYGEEVDGISAQADMVYKGAMMELGVDQGVYDILESVYNTEFKPIWDAMDWDMQLDAADTAKLAALTAALDAAIEGIAALPSPASGPDTET